MTAFLLGAADLFLLVTHLAVVLFNLFGWIWLRTRRWHRICVGLTLFCWLGAGLAVGTIGYCPLTDWHWQVKEAQGAGPLPDSFIDYVLQMVGVHLGAEAVYGLTAGAFALVVVITLGLWVWERFKAAPQG
ncbi:MAG: DUF2784 domain-containing protein [Alphaproteobacteria bacterium]|nr:DUF2784 domain-containing protein [Alphaproteobacteria bacterium]MBU0858390.1 DUF2784 domain-containing protein [Alphaproteobacteria bacterium]